MGNRWAKIFTLARYPDVYVCLSWWEEINIPVPTHQHAKICQILNYVGYSEDTIIYHGGPLLKRPRSSKSANDWLIVYYALLARWKAWPSEQKLPLCSTDEMTRCRDTDTIITISHVDGDRLILEGMINVAVDKIVFVTIDPKYPLIIPGLTRSASQWRRRQDRFRSFSSKLAFSPRNILKLI